MGSISTTEPTMASTENAKAVSKLYNWRAALMVFMIALTIRVIYLLQMQKCILFLHPTVDAYAHYDFVNQLALSLDPQAQLVYFYLCRMAIADDNKAEAGRLARAALGVNPHVPWANQQFETLLATIGDLSGAEKCFETADYRDPWSYQYLMDLATKATEKGDLTLALRAMEAAAKQRPDLPETRRRAECLRSLFGLKHGTKPKRVR